MIQWKVLMINANLEFHHQDPFDRIILAQSIIEEMTIITKDNLFNQYDVSIMWHESSKNQSIIFCI